MVEFDLLIVIWSLRRGVLRGLPHFLVIRELILLEKKQEISIGELINIYLTSFVLLFDPFLIVFMLNLDEKGSN